MTREEFLAALAPLGYRTYGKSLVAHGNKILHVVHGVDKVIIGEALCSYEEAFHMILALEVMA